MKLIQSGSKGADVKAVQYFLVGLGLYRGAVDGDFGPVTKAAVRAYQGSRGLLADGIIGNLTLAVMLGDGLKLTASPDTAKPGTFPPGFPARPAYGPMTSAQASATFGTFRFVAAPTRDNPEGIRITDHWESENIRLFQIPQLVTLGLSQTGNVRAHRLVVAQTIALWQAWEDADLLDLILSWEGMFFARYIRGSRTSLSNHAKGSAFDINAGYNGLGRVPAALGAKGCVRELVPLALRFGFYWGGWFSRGDGMHFEVKTVLSDEAVAAIVAELQTRAPAPA
jgi:hypothetical protein